MVNMYEDAERFYNPPPDPIDPRDEIVRCAREICFNVLQTSPNSFSIKANYIHDLASLLEQLDAQSA
jgi:hypothetical protein